MWLALILALVAVVGLVLLYKDMSPSGGAIVKGLKAPSSGGLSAAEQTGWNLGPQVAQRWDGSEMLKYCSYQCGNVCAQSVSAQGKDQENCFRVCANRCESEIMQGTYNTNPN